MFEKSICLFLVIILFWGCSKSTKDFEERINNEIVSGNFTVADSLISIYLDKSKNDSIKQYFAFEQERMKRIRIDFNRDEQYIKEQLLQYFPDLSEEQLHKWESDKSLEFKIIDGQKRYFNWAHRNLFRVNEEARKKIQVDENQSDALDEFCLDFIPKMLDELKNSGTDTTKDYQFEISYTLAVDSSAVSIGDTVRAWLPYPKYNASRQFEIEFLESNFPQYIIAPDSVVHKSIYFETVVDKSKEIDFQIKYKVTTKGQWLGQQIANIKEYDTKNPLYIEYTSERYPHIMFTEKIRNLADSIVGDKTQPYEVVKAIYTWINKNIPWASAREYSTIPCLPEYCLENMHGDCGIQTLLLISMARYKGIPAKWQSGWILEPGEVGLHDWAEIYYEGLGWVPIDQSFGLQNAEDEDTKYFYTCGFDPYRLIVNDDISQSFYPQKKHFRSETVDFQRGEVETQSKNLYFNQWDYHMDVKYLNE